MSAAINLAKLIEMMNEVAADPEAYEVDGVPTIKGLQMAVNILSNSLDALTESLITQGSVISELRSKIEVHDACFVNQSDALDAHSERIDALEDAQS